MPLPFSDPLPALDGPLPVLDCPLLVLDCACVSRSWVWASRSCPCVSRSRVWLSRSCPSVSRNWVWVSRNCPCVSRSRDWASRNCPRVSRSRIWVSRSSPCVCRSWALRASSAGVGFLTTGFLICFSDSKSTSTHGGLGCPFGAGGRTGCGTGCGTACGIAGGTACRTSCGSACGTACGSGCIWPCCSSWGVSIGSGIVSGSLAGDSSGSGRSGLLLLILVSLLSLVVLESSESSEVSVLSSVSCVLGDFTWLLLLNKLLKSMDRRCACARLSRCIPGLVAFSPKTLCIPFCVSGGAWRDFLFPPFESPFFLGLILFTCKQSNARRNGRRKSTKSMMGKRKSLAWSGCSLRFRQSAYREDTCRQTKKIKKL